MNLDILHRATSSSLDGTMKFPAIVGMLRDAGVESYRADLIHGGVTFYSSQAQSIAGPVTLPLQTVACSYDALAVKDAILASQQAAITYPQFLARVAAAGVAAYQVYIAGRRALYWSRRGDFHVEDFPAALP
jgi:uncharacterized protein YbcV (DUF1398 family)